MTAGPYVGTVGTLGGVPVVFTEMLARGVVVVDRTPSLVDGPSPQPNVNRLIVGAPPETERDRYVRLAVRGARDVVRRGLRRWASDSQVVEWALQDALDELIDRHVDR